MALSAEAMRTETTVARDLTSGDPTPGPLAARLRAVEHEHADLAIEGAHGHDQHALEAQARGERARRGIAAGQVARHGRLRAHGLRGECHVAVLRRDLTGIDAEAEPSASVPVAILEEKEHAGGGVELLAETLESVLEQLVEVVARAATGEDVRAGLGEMGAQGGVVADRGQAADEIGEDD